MAFSLIYTQRAPTRMWPQAVSKPAVLSSRIFSSVLTSTPDAQGSGRAVFSTLPSGPDWGTRRKILLRLDPRHRRPNAFRRQHEILFCEPEFQQEPDRAYLL